MKHLLRYSLMCALSLLCLGANAQGVTFDFDNDYATLFPTLAGTSSNESHDGDFTASTTATVGGFSVTVSPADEGVTNANRIWSSAPRLRMYSGTLTVSGSGITKIEFTHKAGNFNLTASTGTLTDNVWTGNANEVVFSCSKNTQINKIVINGDGGSGEEPGGNSSYGTAEAPLTVAEALAIATALEAGATTPDGVDVYTKGVVTEITTEWSSQYNNVSFNISNDGGTTKLLIYRCKSGSADYVLAGDEVVIKGKLKKYVKNDVVTLEYDAGCEIISLVQGDGHSGTPGPGGDDINYGTIDAPLTVAEAIAAAIANGTEASAKDYYVKGKICSIKYEYSAQYGTATYNISEDGNEGTEFTVYSSYYFDGKAWQEGDTQIKVGDEVIVCGKIINYNGNTPEFASKQNYLVSLNGQTSSGSGENPEAALNHGTAEAPISVAEAIAAAETIGTTASAEDFFVKGKICSIKYEYSAQYGTATYNISEDGNEGTEFTVYSSYYFDGRAWQDGDMQIAVGDEVIVRGKIINYNGNTPEFASKQNYLVSLNGQTSSGSGENPEDALNHGTAEAPISVAEAIAAAEVIGTTASAEDFFVKGKICSIKYEYSAQYGTATYNISEDGSEGTEFTVYSSYYLDGKAWQEGDEQIAVGDEVIVRGKIINYNGNTPEFASKQNYLVSLNKATGIQNVKISATNGAIYNIAGQRVEKATKGIYIQNGKKYIVK